jgi:hypothetical protein
LHGRCVQFPESEHLVLWIFSRPELPKTLAERTLDLFVDRWRTDCSLQGMANLLTLAPEEDDPISRGDLKFGRSSRNSAKGQDFHAEAKAILTRFDPHKVGFGILPAFSTDRSVPLSDTVAIAMQYLLEGSDQTSLGEKK